MHPRETIGLRDLKALVSTGGLFMEKGSFFNRAIAFAIDAVAMVVLSWLVVFLMSFLLAPFAGGDSSFARMMNALIGSLIAVVGILFQFLYFGFMWSRDGQSIGMKLTTIKVARRDGSPLSFFRAALRGSVGYWISGVIFFLGFIWAAFDKNGEAWHDKIFDTRVFEHPYDPYGSLNYPAPRPPTDAGPGMN
jgi:uncharacterized RDD family membrane protein YckC